MFNQNQLQAQCPACGHKWLVPFQTMAANYNCPRCPSMNIILSPSYETKDMKQKPKSEK